LRATDGGTMTSMSPASGLLPVTAHPSPSGSYERGNVLIRECGSLEAGKNAVQVRGANLGRRGDLDSDWFVFSRIVHDESLANLRDMMTLVPSRAL
jgi:hypothetical protein